MANLVAYKPILSKADIYQSSVQTNYVKDQTTGELFKTSGLNTRSSIQEQCPSAQLFGGTILISSPGGSQTYYTVPDGKILILMEMNVSFSYHGRSDGIIPNYAVEIEDPNGNIAEFMKQVIQSLGNVRDNLSLPNLFILDSNSKIYYTCSGAGTWHSSFRATGFLINKNDLPTLSLNPLIV